MNNQTSRFWTVVLGSRSAKVRPSEPGELYQSVCVNYRNGLEIYSTEEGARDRAREYRGKHLESGSDRQR